MHVPASASSRHQPAKRCFVLPILLFVYGSLRREAPGGMCRLLQPGTRSLGVGWVRGRLLDLGAYPGLVRSPAGWVTGELHRLLDAEAVLARLDRYEACSPHDPPPHEFERVRLPVRRVAGAAVTAWAYLFRGDPGGCRVIVSGDYVRAAGSRRRSARPPPTLADSSGQ